MIKRSMFKTSTRLAAILAAGAFLLTVAGSAQAGWYGPGGAKKPTEWTSPTYNPTQGHKAPKH